MEYSKLFQNVLKKEAEAILRVADLNHSVAVEKIVKVFEVLRTNGGSLVTCGVGKSGNIASKISSTFCSLGLPSFVLHPTDALHGDLGRVTKWDAFLFISKSGTTEEILKLIPFLPISKEMCIGLVGNIESPIALKCGIVFDCSVKEEACLNNQAPTTSTAVAMAIGDSLAVVYEDLVGLSKENFAQNHPGGLLGKSLALKVSDLMIKKTDCSVVSQDQTLQDVLLSMTKFPVGLCAVLEGSKILGIIVEGDIRRTLNKDNRGLSTKVIDMMNPNPIAIAPNDLAYTALRIMEAKDKQKVVLPVIDKGEFIGVIRIHDLLKEGFSKK